MRKFFFMLCVMMPAMLTFAQEAKKVAILETVDKQGNISYANKLMLRSNLAKAITNTPGYEAYDRTDIDAILNEQNFQRTGMVSAKQIKRLGDMTGAKYVLVAEAAVADASNMFITAKLLDVETARTEVTDNQIMGITAREIQRGCQLLAERMMKQVSGAKTFSVISKSGTQETQVPQEKQSLTRLSSNEYQLKGQKLDKKAYLNFLQNNCPKAYAQHTLGSKLVTGGWTAFGCGLGLIVGGGIMVGLSPRYYFDNGNVIYDPALHGAGVALISIGAISTAASVPLLAIGYVKQKKAVDIYNLQCASETPVAFNLTVGQNGLGVAMNF